MILGRECTIRGEITTAILLDGANVPHFTYVGGSVLGREVNMGAGSQILNLERRKRPIQIRTRTELIETGLVKFGAILGDGCYIGGNASLNPAVLLGPNSFVYPGVVVPKGIYPSGSQLKGPRQM